MPISHADHDHPNTPAARAACRKQIERGTGPLKVQVVDTCPGTPHRKHTRSDDPCPAVKPAQMTVVPRRRGDGGVVKGMIAAQPVIKGTKVKAYETPIRTAGDLPADIPANLVRTIEAAWAADLPVILGARLNDTETRILIGGSVAQVSLVFNAGGDSGVFVRSLTSSITRRVDSGPMALALASGEDEWPWVSAGKLV